MKKVHQVCLAISLTGSLVACGGGGDSVAPAGPLTALAGTWVSDCDSGVRNKVIVTANSIGTEIEIKYEIDYFAAADCSGSAGASLHHKNASVSGLSKGKTETDLKNPDDSTQSFKAETAEITVIAGAPNVLSSGLNVSQSTLTKNQITQKEWCVYGVAGQTYCFFDNDVALDSGTKLAAFYVKGTTLYTFQDDDSDRVFEASGTFKRLP